MWRALLLVPLVLAGCLKGPEADLQYIGQARSLAAEWALVNEQASEGKLTPAYVKSMHQWLRDNLQTAQSSLSEPDSAYGHEIAALLTTPDGAPSSELRARAATLKQIEDKLESA